MDASAGISALKVFSAQLRDKRDLGTLTDADREEFRRLARPFLIDAQAAAEQARLASAMPITVLQEGKEPYVVAFSPCPEGPSLPSWVMEGAA